MGSQLYSDQEYKKAIDFFLKSADLGNPVALTSLGVCYFNGNGTEQSYSKAIEYFQKACDLVNSDGLVNLALCYDNGDGVEQDCSKAIELYQKAADFENSEALLNLALHYINGQGIEKDNSKASQKKFIINVQGFINFLKKIKLCSIFARNQIVNMNLLMKISDTVLIFYGDLKSSIFTHI